MGTPQVLHYEILADFQNTVRCPLENWPASHHAEEFHIVETEHLLVTFQGSFKFSN